MAIRYVRHDKSGAVVFGEDHYKPPSPEPSNFSHQATAVAPEHLHYSAKMCAYALGAFSGLLFLFTSVAWPLIVYDRGIAPEWVWGSWMACWSWPLVVGWAIFVAKTLKVDQMLRDRFLNEDERIAATAQTVTMRDNNGTVILGHNIQYTEEDELAHRLVFLVERLYTDPRIITRGSLVVPDTGERIDQAVQLELYHKYLSPLKIATKGEHGAWGPHPDLKTPEDALEALEKRLAEAVKG